MNLSNVNEEWWRIITFYIVFDSIIPLSMHFISLACFADIDSRDLPGRLRDSATSIRVAHPLIPKFQDTSTNSIRLNCVDIS